MKGLLKYLHNPPRPKGHTNCITGSKFTAILLNGGIFPIGGVASGTVCAQPGKQACLYTLSSCMSVFMCWLSVVHLGEILYAIFLSLTTGYEA